MKLGKWQIAVAGMAVFAGGAAALGVALRHHLYLGPSLPDTDFLAEWRELGAKSWGVDTPGSWKPVAALVAMKQNAEDKAATAVPRPSDVRRREAAIPVYDPEMNRGWDYWRPYDPGNPDDLAAWRWHRTMGDLAAEELRASGFIERIIDLPNSVPVLEGMIPVDVNVRGPVYSSFSGLSPIARYLRLAMRLASEEQDAEAFRAAGMALATLSRVSGAQPLVICWLHEIAFEAMLLGELLHVVNNGASMAMAQAALDTLNVHRVAEIDRVMRGALLSYALTYPDPQGNSVLAYKHAAANHAAATVVYDAIAQAVSLDPIKGVAHVHDTALALASGPLRGTMFARELRDAFETFGYVLETQLVQIAHRAKAERIALRTALALETFRIRTGRFPGELDELVGRELRATPIDPFTGAVLGYRVGDNPEVPAIQGGCRLWLAGRDGVDNGGTVPTGEFVNAFQDSGAASDHVILGTDAFFVGE
ncbi:MAG: hypothetical protein AAGI53_15605 [Planctomycetota bacterium]